MTSFHIQTFGCKANQYESQAIRESMAAHGFIPAAGAADADICIINTCSVTGRAGASCRNAVRKNLRANPGARIVVTGCGVDLGDAFPDLSGRPPLLVPNAKKHALPRLLALADPWPGDVAAVSDDRFALSISCFHGHTRAFIKIHDGCDNFCSYCAVPFARGAPESRPLDAIRDEALRLVGHGHRELVLTGINIGNYRHGSFTLPDVVTALAATPGLVRLRLGSVEPPSVTAELVRAMASSDAVCPHVHVPLQAGDDGVLAAMGRRYTVRDYLEKIALLRSGLDNPAVTADVIAGFPGEDAAAAERTLAVCREAEFSRLHVFLFSARPGTKAAAMRQTATDRDIEERKKILLVAGEEMAASYAASCVGLRERVIMETGGAGLSDRYAAVRLDASVPAGAVVTAEITGAEGAVLRGRVLR